MTKSSSEKLFFRTRKVSALLGVPLSTLRYWEDEFVQFNPERTAKGHRRYTPDDVTYHNDRAFSDR